MAILYFWLGLAIAFSSFKNIHNEWKSMLLVFFLQLLVVPLIGFWFSQDLAVDSNRNVLLLLALSPGGVTSAIAARVMKLNLAINVAFTSLTALVYLFIVQPFVIPMIFDTIKLNAETLLSFLLCFVALSIVMLINHKLPKLAKWLDKILSICILGSVVYYVTKEYTTIGGVEISLVWLTIKFHLAVLIASAVLSSLFLGVNRAPLVVLESGFHNVSLVAAIVIPLGWSPILPILYGVIMFLSASIMWLNLTVVRKSKLRIIIIENRIIQLRGLTIPPFGMFIHADLRSITSIKKGILNWRRFKKLGLLGFYLETTWSRIAKNASFYQRNE